MKLIKLITLVFVAGLIATSCSIEERVSFDENLESGSVNYSVDMSALMALYTASEMKNELDFFDGFKTDKNKDNPFLGIDGITNFKFDGSAKEGSMRFSYDFNSLQALNQSQSLSALADGQNDMFSMLSSESSAQSVQFTKKKKTLSYKSAVLNAGDLGLDKNGNTNPMFDGAGKMFAYKLIFEFDKPVKKLKNKNYLISSDRKTVQIEGDLLDMVSGELKSDFKAKF